MRDNFVNNGKEATEKERLPFVVSDIKVLVKLAACENNESCVWFCSVSR